jgi:glucokinase
MTRMQEHALSILADIGATNARFALSDADGIREPEIFRCADFPTLDAAMAAYLADAVPPEPPRRAAIAVAGPVTGDRVAMTNHAWSFSIAALKTVFGFEHLAVINDFTAVALAAPHLRPEDRRQIGGGAPAARDTIGLIGPGTGLGVSALAPAGATGWTALAGEGGHATMTTVTAREDAVIARLRQRFGHVSAERVLSGMGLVNLYETLALLSGHDPENRDPASVSEGARAGDPACIEALAMFSAMLGTVAGNLALTVGARGGVYIAGGVVAKLGTLFDDALFRQRFEAKGRLASFVCAIPTYLITHPLPAFLGLRAVAAG